MQSPKTAFFVFALLPSLHILHLCPCIMSGSVVRCQRQRLFRAFTDKKGQGGKPFRRQSPHFHFIAGSILAIKPCLSQSLPFYATETKTTDPTERRIKKMSDMREAGKKKKLKLNSLTYGIRIKSKITVQEEQME